MVTFFGSVSKTKKKDNPMAQETTSPRKHSNSYNIFILVLTILSLVVMVVLLLPLSDDTIKLLSVYDNLICVIFLIDFFYNLKTLLKNPITL